MDKKATNRRKRSNVKYLERQSFLINNLPEHERTEFEMYQKNLLSKELILEGEIWKPLFQWESIYEISNYGRIKTIKDDNIRTPHLHHSCYYTISLHEEPKRIKYCILSRLIAINFIDNPQMLPEVNHKNKIRIDCRTSNLEWATSKDNSKHKMMVDCSSDTKREIVQLNMDGSFIRTWGSISSAANSVGKSGANIVTVCQNKNDYAYGYIWMYKDDYDKNGIKERYIQKKYREILTAEDIDSL